MSRRPLLQEGTITNSSVARPDRGGEALLRGAPAVLEPLEWETDSLEDGARLFLDADHTFAELPEALSGKSFIRSSFFGTRKVCRQPGIAFAITPARGQGRPSRADQLERMAFRQASVPAIRVFSDGTAVDCSVYQKQMREGERIDIGSPGLVLTTDAPWCVLVAAAHTSAGKTGDHERIWTRRWFSVGPARPKSFLASTGTELHYCSRSSRSCRVLYPRPWYGPVAQRPLSCRRPVLAARRRTGPPDDVAQRRRRQKLAAAA